MTRWACQGSKLASNAEALACAVQVVGSASLFGDPVRLFHHLGLGVWSFLANPAAGGSA